MYFVFFFKQKTAYEMRISDWSSDVCSSDLANPRRIRRLTSAHAAAIAIGMATMAESTELDAQTLVARMASAGRAAQRRMASLRSDEIGRASCRERVCQ